ncbi:hypothetical protein [Planococcus alpniumensis]|uniref:hypothetical protein n=1 Tax=Planococcus alpniumensis TaxID=2708345 RepID=UPI001B8C6947|nr:hypothetical protein [Planococcus sp. MSAK28401]
MKLVGKSIVIASFSMSLFLTGCSFDKETYGLTNKEYKLVDKYYDADKMVQDLEKLGYNDAAISAELNAALMQVKRETGN